MSNESDYVVELAIPPEAEADPAVAEALEKLSSTLAAEGLLIDGEVEGFGFAKPPVRVNALPVGKPSGARSEFVCFGNYFDDESLESTCYIRFG